ncbi:MAG: HD domain-containing protein [Clostridia bacterium]|nr:HD domain-containing protein [Clostridia bacterium]
MFDEIDERFELIAQQFSQDSSSADMVRKAYHTARHLHQDQRRKDGQFYISHPVEVALILANLGFDADVVSGALLHDVVEDCDCDLETIRKEFNDNVAEMVDCVSAIDKEKFVFDKDDLFENENFEKAAIEEQSFKKLIAIGRKNPLGFCIKFADRLHNLRTIDCFQYGKQLEKVKETEKWILPVARILNSEYFFRSITNECFKIKHKFDGKEFFEQYENYHKLNAENIDKLTRRLQEIFANSCINEVEAKNVREYKVYEDLNKLVKTINISRISQGQILKVTNFNIYLLYKNGKYKDNIVEVLTILNKNLGSGFKIIDAKIGNFTKKPYFQVEDEFKNKYNFYVMSVADHILQRNGTLDGQNDELLDADNIDNLDVELIKVKTRSGEIKYIPKGSTALDFAFKIHKAIGFGFKYAIINSSKTKCPPYTKLLEGDQVEIVIDKSEKGEISNNAELKWLAYVNSDFAKKVLIRHFEKLGFAGKHSS